jgi:hypothetical protein
VGIPFLLLGVTLAVAGIGWFKCRLWGWRLAVAAIATQVLGDLVNAFSGHVVEGGLGVAIAGALLLYLLSANVKAVFASREHEFAAVCGQKSRLTIKGAFEGSQNLGSRAAQK